MKKVSALCIAVLSGLLVAGCDRTDFFEFAKNGWRTATPVFTPKPGSYLTADGFAGQVEISCDTEGAVIVYTIDDNGLTPPDPEYDSETGTAVTGSLYTEGTPVSIPSPSVTTIKAMAYTTDKGESKLAQGEYLVDQTVGTPYYDYAAGSYTEPIDVEILCDTPGASIRYTTGEFDYPTETTGIVYTGNPVRISQPTYLRAIAYKAGMMSASTEAYYDVVTTLDTVATPTFSVAAGTYTSSFTVEIDCATSGADIYYSYDNITYDLYTGALTISATTTVYAYATASGMIDSENGSVSYIIDIPLGTVETPYFSVTGGTYYDPFDVEIYCDTPGAEIYYSYDDVNYYLYSSALNIAGATSLYAYAIASGMDDSLVASTVYSYNTRTVSFVSANQAGGEESGDLTVTLDLSVTSTNAVTVPFTIGGTATQGSDFTISPSSEVAIPAGNGSGTITVTLSDDAVYEGNETIILTMGTPTNADASGVTQHTITITDNDAQPEVAFDIATSGIVEPASGDNFLNIRINLTGGTAFPASVDYVVTAGTATGGGTDYTLASGTVNFAVGVTYVYISPTVYADALVEGDETFTITLSNPVNAQLGSMMNNTVTIMDNITALEAQWVAVGNGMALYSPDGEHWFLGSSNSGVLRSVASDGTYCVAVGDSGIVNYSSDGENWTNFTGLSGNFNGVCTDEGGTYVAVGPSTGIYYSDGNGIESSWYNAPQSFTSTQNGAAFDGSRWYSVGGTYRYYAEATTYSNPWTSLSTATSDLYAVTANSSPRLVMVGASGHVASSQDQGGGWSTTSAGSDTLRGVAIDSTSNCVAVGDYGNIYYTSNPAGTWTAAGTNPFSGYTIYSVATDSSGTWIVVGQGGLIGISTDDGATWTQLSSPTTADLYSVCPR